MREKAGKHKESFCNYTLYTYDLSKLKNSCKVRFVYALKGRGKEKGLVKELKGRFIAPGCFIIPVKNDKEMQEIMCKWGVKFSKIKIMIPKNA